MLKSGSTPTIEKFSIRLGMFFSKIPISANTWTLLSIVPAILGFVSLLYKQMLYALILFFFSAFIDAIDGSVARVTGTVTNLGAYLDGMMDRIVEFFLILGLMSIELPDLSFYNYTITSQLLLTLLLFIGTAMVSYSRAYASHKKAIKSEEALKKMGGLFERPERLLLIFLGMVAYFAMPIYLTYTIAIAVLFSVVTLIQRVWFVIKNKE
jgi:phosphatidylglycerophosphate synthase